MRGAKVDGPVPSTAPATDPSPERERQLTRYVSALAVLAVAVAGAAVVLGPEPAPVGGWLLAAVFGLALVATELIRVEVRIGPMVQSTTLVELAVVPLILLFSPATALVTAAAASLVGEALLRQRDLRKVSFNLSWHVAGVALSSLTYAVLSGGGAFDRPRSIAAAAVAAAVFIVWNFTALSGVAAIMSGRTLRRVLADGWRDALPLNVVAAVVGVLIAILTLEAPAVLPLLALLGLLIHERQRDQSATQDRLAAELDRFERTLAGTSDGVVLLDQTGTVEVWNPAMAAITGIAESRAVGADLEELGWARLVDLPVGEEGELRLQLSDRVLAARRAAVPGTRPGRAGTVVTVRDVSREAEVARIRDDLVMRISHELRTPLTSVDGFLEVLTRQWDHLGDAGRQELVQASRRGSRRLAQLVTNLMVWAGIESRTGAAAPTGGRSHVPEVLHDVLADLDLPRGDIHLEAGEATAVAIDADDLHTVLANLVANATLYGAPPVSVVVRRRGVSVELEVIDRGPGVPPAFRPHLFEPFSQATDGLQRTAKGLGLGLAIVRALAIAHGGDVRYADAPDGGARFTVSLPAAEPHPVVLPSGSGAATGSSSSNL